MIHRIASALLCALLTLPAYAALKARRQGA